MWEKIKVVELASVLAGPAVGMFFAELGTEVIKVENKKTGGDMTRKWKLSTESRETAVSAYFSSINYGKSYLSIDLSNEEEQNQIHQLIKDADIVLANFKPGSAQKFKMDYETIKGINPKIIYGEITGFSNSDDRPAFDVVLQAETGFMSMNGTPDGPPVKMPVALIDVLAAHQLKEGILTAMLEQKDTGLPYYVSVSLFDAAIASLVNQASNYLMNNYIPTKMGSAHPNIAPYGDLFQTSDGKHLVLAIGTEKQFEQLCDILGLPLKDQFNSNPKRVKNRTELVEMLQTKISDFHSDQLIKELLDRKIPAGIVKNLQEVFQSETAKQLVLEEKIEDRETKRVKSKVFKIYS